MYGIVHTYSGIGKPLNYNEKKVRSKQAECLYAGNFLKNADELDVKEKRERFQDQMTLNQRTTSNVLQFIIGFSPNDRPDREKMIDIAKACMQRTGFAQQPYLVYTHLDAGRPHFHILTTRIRPDGSRMPFSVLKDWVSEKIDRQLTLEFGLSHGKNPASVSGGGQILPFAEKARYGDRPTLHIIGDVLQYVLHAFNYRSFEQLNAILRLYNVKASRGLPGSRLDQYHGLLYMLLNDQGKTISTPIKASTFFFKPILSWLEKKFTENALLEPREFQRTRLAIDTALREKPIDSDQFAAALRSEQVATDPIFDKQGQLTGLFFLDLNRRIVVSPKDIGAQYNATALREKLGFDPFPAPSKIKSVPKQAAQAKRSRETSPQQHRHR